MRRTTAQRRRFCAAIAPCPPAVAATVLPPILLAGALLALPHWRTFLVEQPRPLGTAREEAWARHWQDHVVAEEDAESIVVSGVSDDLHVGCAGPAVAPASEDRVSRALRVEKAIARVGPAGAEHVWA